jgi:hypothetical protein
MASSRPFAYNTGSSISGTEQVGTVSVGIPISSYESTGLEWWNGPDEELGYVICLPVSGDTQKTPVKYPIYLDISNRGTDITLSGSPYQTAYQQPGYQQSVLGQDPINQGDKVMFSVLVSLTQPGTQADSHFIGIGYQNMNYQGNPYGGYPGSDSNSIGYCSNGNLCGNGGIPYNTASPWTDGDIIDILINTNTSGMSVRVNGGDWDNNPSTDPVANPNMMGIEIFSPPFYPVLCPGYEGTMTIQNQSTYAVPTGYKFLGDITASVKFIRSASLTNTSFRDLVNSYFNQNLLTAQACKSYLTTNDIWTSWGSLPSGMVLYLDAGIASSYPGSGSTWYDLSGYGNHGTINGATYSSSQGGVLGFDGVNDYISFNTVSNIPIGNDNYTVSIWFNTTSSNTTGGFFGWGNYGTTNQVNAFRLLANGAGFVNYWWANDQNFFTTVNPNTWYNVIAKFDGTNREIWLDGVLVGSVAPSPGHNVPDANNLTIGLTAPFLNEYFPGKIGQVVFYRRGATDQEIQEIYNSGASRFV